MSTIEAMKMCKSGRLSDEQEEPEDEIPEEPLRKAKKNRSDKRTTNIATLDNETMVEAFKYLNYSQLAKKSLVSKRFWNLIGTNRHRLALLCVDNISMHSKRYALSSPAFVKVFNNVFSLEKYNEWVVGNQYSKQILLEDPNHWIAFHANAELNHENWPLFQHFVRLLTDPFIHISSMELAPQNDVLNLLTGAIDHNRLQCEHLIFNLDGNVQKFMSWIKGHMHCDEIQLNAVVSKTSNHFKSLLDFFATGSRCTSAIATNGITANVSKAVNNIVQKFMNLKSSNECQMVESIRGCVSKRKVDAFKRDYAKFIIEEAITSKPKLRFEFVNNAVEKKLELIFSNCGSPTSCYSLQFENL